MTDSILSTACLARFAEFKQLFLGFSGGLDSTVLLYSLSKQPSLIKKLTAVHINHGLSKNAYEWQAHCQKICNEWNIPLITKSVELSQKGNIEEEAREARYQVFASLIKVNDCLVLGHHRNDQAETILLHLLRGTGVDGLAAMPLEKAFAKGRLLRPLLAQDRVSLENYAYSQQLRWIDDESNQNLSFSRNYLRHKILPLLQKRWPTVAQNLARTANHCQEAKANLEALARIDCPDLNKTLTSLTIGSWVDLGPARIDNVLRLWFKQNQLKLPNSLTFKRLRQEVLTAREDANPSIVWDNKTIRRYKKTLYITELKVSQSFLKEWSSFPELFVLDKGYIQANKAKKGLTIPKQSRITVKFRQGGESLRYHGQTKQLKKLFQEWKLPPWRRDEIPLLYVDDQLAMVIGYAISDDFYSESSDAYEISFKCG